MNPEDRTVQEGLYWPTLLTSLVLLALAVLLADRAREARIKDCAPDPCAKAHCPCPTSPQVPVREASPTPIVVGP